MGFMDNIWDSAKSFAGNIPKAMLIVKHPSVVQKDPATNFFQKDKDRTLDQKTQNKKKLDELRAALAKQYKSNKGLALRFDDVKSLVASKQAEGVKYTVMEVQYNPSSIRFDTSGGSRYEMSEGKMDLLNYQVATTMRVQLIFENINLMDAFMLQNLNPNVGNIKEMAQSKFSDGGFTNNKEYSVQTQLDGLLALLQRSETRHVVFAYSGLFFPGEVCGVTVKYTMFNKKGNPVMGTADIEIYQDDNYRDDKNESYWDKAYKTFFEENNTTKGGFSKVNNNILGLNL